jgi:nucleoid-associated protein YgaU
MPLFQGSRYRFGRVIQIIDANLDVNRVHELRQTSVEPPEGSVPYTVQAGDTFESLAAKRYGDGNKWYIIADVNPQVFFPLDLEAGEVIYIPPRSYAAIR